MRKQCLLTRSANSGGRSSLARAAASAAVKAVRSRTACRHNRASSTRLSMAEKLKSVNHAGLNILTANHTCWEGDNNNKIQPCYIITNMSDSKVIHQMTVLVITDKPGNPDKQISKQQVETEQRFLLQNSISFQNPTSRPKLNHLDFYTTLNCSLLGV